jgi:fucose permease
MQTVVEEVAKVKVPGWLRWQIGLAFFAFILIGANDGAVGVILPSLREHYNIDKGTAGLLFLASTSGYLMAALSSGTLVAKLGKRLFLMLGTFLFVVGTLTISFAPLFGIGLVALLVVGFGVAIIDAGLNAYIAGLPNSTATLNYLHAFYGMGALLGPIIASGLLAVGAIWNNVYLVWVALGLVAILGFALFYNHSVPQAEASNAEEEATHSGNMMGIALRTRAVWVAAAFLLFYVGLELSMGSWGYTFLTEERHQADLLSGWTVSGYWLGLTLGRLVMGRLAVRIGNKNLIQGCLVGVVVGVVLVWVAPLEIVAALGFWVTGFSLGPIFPTTIALMPTIVPARILPTAIGFLVSLGAMGAALFPWLAGTLMQGFGLWALLPYVMVLAVLDFSIWRILQHYSKATA